MSGILMEIDLLIYGLKPQAIGLRSFTLEEFKRADKWNKQRTYDLKSYDSLGLQNGGYKSFFFLY